MPDLDLPTAGGGRFNLGQSHSSALTMLVFYRGLHCPICKTYLRDLDRKLAEFEKLGVAVVAVSTDDRERAEQTRADWDLEHLTIAYGLGIEQARQWGLFISAAVKDDEPTLFAEPGLFLIRPDGTLYAASVQTMPFARPQFSEVLAAIGFVIKKDYPARGEA